MKVSCRLCWRNCAVETDEEMLAIDKMEDPCGKAYYVKAVAGAREGDTEIMFNALRTAVAKEPKLKEHAAKDLEFFQYFEDAAFKEIDQ